MREYRQRRDLDRRRERLLREEQKLLREEESALVEEKLAPLCENLLQKAPQKAIEALQAAFYQAFSLLFGKGSSMILKSCLEPKRRENFRKRDSALRQETSRQNFSRLDRGPAGAARVNTCLCAAEGAVLGVLGIGLPDIPLLMGMLLRAVYQTALGYGFSVDSDEERAYVLYLLCLSAVKGEQRREYSRRADQLGWAIDAGHPCSVRLEELQKETARVLAEAMLGVKLVQGVPLIGAVAALSNASAAHAAARAARIKYQKRYLAGLGRARQAKWDRKPDAGRTPGEREWADG